MFSTPQSEKDAAAERVAALWRSRIAAQRQLVSARNNPVPPRAMDPAGPRVKYPTERRARFVDSSRSRSRSRTRHRSRSGTRQRSKPYDEVSRPRNRRMSRSLSTNSGNDSPSRTQRTQQQSQNPSDESSTKQVSSKVPSLKQNQELGNSQQSSSNSSPIKNSKNEKSYSVDSRKLVGSEAEHPNAGPLVALFLKSVMGRGETPSNKSSSKELLSSAGR
jgi:hypothetical protein